MPGRFDDLRQRTLAANLAVVQAGLVVLTFGNVSAVDRDAGVVAIKPSGIPYDALDADSIVVVDLESEKVVEGARRPSSDTPTHLVLYRHFTQIGCVVHTHSPAATSWAQARRDLPCLGTTHADHFNGPIPHTRPLTTGEIEGAYEACTGIAIVETFRARGIDPHEVPAALVASHGPFVWGPTIETAVENAIALETVASMAAMTLSIDASTPPVPPTLQERHHSRKHGAGAYYGQGA